MKKKQLILICAAVLCVLVILFVMSAVSGKTGREQTAAEPQSVSEQTSKNNETSSVAETEKTENNSATEQESTAEPDEKNTETETRRETSTKATTQMAPQTTAGRTETTSKEKQTITVSFSVSCKNALSYGADVPQSGYIIGQTQLTLKQGQTVFDALEAACEKNGASLRYQSKSYITGIGGLNEKDCGGASGWMYRVNGETPMKGASKYTLQDGDVVEWYYVTSASDR